MYCGSVCGDDDDDEIFVLEIKNADCVLSIERNLKERERKKERHTVVFEVIYCCCCCCCCCCYCCCCCSSSSSSSSSSSFFCLKPIFVTLIDWLMLSVNCSC